MKVFFSILLLLFSFNKLFAVEKMYLNNNWKFKQARGVNWYEAEVPGVVHIDLLNNGLIPDPYIGLNERMVQWVDKEDWIYESEFFVRKELLNYDNINLIFEGLDTYADIYLNDSLLFSSDNMFLLWSHDVNGILRNGLNRLKVCFYSPLKIDLPKWESYHYKLKTPNDQSENGGMFDRKVGVFARKAGYHYGWDWGPRLVTSGIWRPVYLECWDDIKIEDIYYKQECITKEKAKVRAVINILSDKKVDNADVEVLVSNGQKFVKHQSLINGKNEIIVDIDIKNPRLWWTNGLGEPYLYNFTANVSIDGKITDSKKTRVGLHTIKLKTEKDNVGSSFYFELNGVPVFMKGANYIPCDVFLPKVTDSIYIQTILDAKKANMNMLRVWGGGIYENDIFYDLCDEHGILVWQDFMFACALYPGDKEFLNNVRKEAEYNIIRLRNHPSIALWCGNNECQDAWFTWGWKEEYENIDPAFADKLWSDFKKLYYEVLPDCVSEYSFNVPYRASSPMATSDSHSNLRNGDYHYWGVWGGRSLYPVLIVL